MKRFTKIASLILALTLILSSCTTVNGTAKKITKLIAEGNFGECRELTESLDKETAAAINDTVAAAVTAKFRELTAAEKLGGVNLYDLTAYSREFTESCRSLWDIAEEFTVTEEYDGYADWISLHFFAVMSDLMRYRELYALFTEVNANGYLGMLDLALAAYEKSGDKSGFEPCYKAAQKLDYSPYDPQQYLISDFRAAHDELVKGLRSLINDFNMDNYEGASKIIAQLRINMAQMLTLIDTLRAVNTQQTAVYSSLSSGGLYRSFTVSVEIAEREYTPGIGMSLSFLAANGAPNTNAQDIPDMSHAATVSLSKEEAVKKAVDAINGTKKYTEKLDITLKNDTNISLISFNSESASPSATEIVKAQFDAFLKSESGSAENTYSFTSGLNGAKKLADFIPPEGRESSLTPQAVGQYSAARGSAGYVLSFVLLSEYGTMTQPAQNIGSFVGGFTPEITKEVAGYGITYYPSSITVAVNNDGRLSKLQYSLKGNCSFELVSNSNKYTAETDFTADYTYSFKY